MANRLSGLLVACALMAGGTLAQAQTSTYTFTLAATSFGGNLPVFGITSLPTGPFQGVFTYDGQLAPNLAIAPLALTSFALTIGNTTWNLGNSTSVTTKFSTDAAGDLLFTGFKIEFYLNQGANFSFFRMNDDNTVPTSRWEAIDVSTPPWMCMYGPNGVVGGNCLGGGSGTMSFARVSPVPEPAAWLMTLVGVAAIGTWHRRRLGARTVGTTGMRL